MTSSGAPQEGSEPGRQVLDIDVAGGDADVASAASADQHGIDVARRSRAGDAARPAGTPRPGGDADALEDAQRTGLEAQLVLRVQRVGQQRRAGDEAGEIEQAAVSARIAAAGGAQRRRRLVTRRGGARCSSRSTSSREVWRMSLPCTM